MNIDFPLHFNTFGKTSVADRDEHIRDMIELLLFTIPGERVNRPDFGCGLQQFVFSPNSPEVASGLQVKIQGDLQKWLSDLVIIKDLKVTSEDAKLKVVISYRVHNQEEDSKLELTKEV